MAPISSTYSGIADLLQTFSGVGSASLSSALNSPTVQSALQNSSPADIVQLSDQAVRLQQTAELFGGATGGQTSADTAASLLPQFAGQSEGDFTADPYSSAAAQSYSAAGLATSDPYGSASLSYLA